MFLFFYASYVYILMKSLQFNDFDANFVHMF